MTAPTQLLQIQKNSQMKERNTEMRGLNFYNIYWLNEKNIFQHSTEGYPGPQ